MEERTTVEKRTRIVPDAGAADSTNINIDANTGATTVETNEPAPRKTTVEETTVERTTRS